MSMQHPKRAAQAAKPLFGRALPASEQAERSVLSAVLLNSDAISLVCDLLVAQDFHNQAHQELYQTLIELYQHGKPLDIVTVQDSLASKDRLERVGGLT